MNSEKEIKQKVLALVTAVYELQPGDVSGDPMDNPLIAAVAAGGLLDYDLDLSGTVTSAADVEAMINDAVAQLTAQVSAQSFALIGYFLTLFFRLVHEYENACPEADVRGLLQREALEVAAETEDG